MLALFATLLSSVFSGGATGLLGILIQRFFDAKSKAQDIDVIRLNHENAVALKRIEIEQTAKEWEGRQAVAYEDREARQIEAESEERSRAAEADADMFAASHESDRARYLSTAAQKKSKWAVALMGSVDWVRGMIRPLLTLYLVILTHLMFNWARDLAATQGAELSSAEVKEIIVQIISTLLYLATVAVVWWFGTRPPKKQSDR